ncbi:MAG: hypothetical protein ACTSW1_11180 [Candidatus Hodarchaeales archaeon]
MNNLNKIRMLSGFFSILLMCQIFLPNFVDGIAPTTFNCSGTVSSSLGGRVSGVKVQLYGLLTGGITPDSAINGLSSGFSLSRVTGYWTRLAVSYSDSSGHYQISSQNTNDKTQIKIVFSKSGYYSKTIYFYTNKGSYTRDVTLIHPPPAPTGLVWYKEGVIDIAFNTPEAFVTWDIDKTPYQGYLEVATLDGTILQTITLSQEQLDNHYMIYTCPYGSDYYQLRLKMRNYDAKYNVYSNYAYTSWKVVHLIDSNSFFALGGYRYAYIDRWSHPDLSNVKASVSILISFEEVVVNNVNYLDVSVAAHYYSSGKRCLLANGLRVKLTNRDGIEYSKTLKSEQDIYMKAYNYQGTDLNPLIESTGSIIPFDPMDPTKWMAAMGYIITAGNLYYGVTNIGLTIWGAVGLGMNVAKFFWFDLPNSNSDYASGDGAHCQTTFNTAGSLTALNRPYEVITFSKFRIKPAKGLNGMEFDLKVDSNGYMWNGEIGMYWSQDAYLSKTINVFF